MKNAFDLVVLGAGSGGLAAAKRAAKYGAKVAKSSEEAISNPNTDVVFIASATPTHINYILSINKYKCPIL